MPEPTSLAKRVRLAEIVGYGVAAIAVGFVALLIIGSVVPPETGEQKLARIKAACEREFGAANVEAVSSCQVAIAVRTLSAAEDRKLKNAFDASR